MIKTISIENAKRLYELEVENKSYFAYVENGDKEGEFRAIEDEAGFFSLRAYTACEMDEMFPDEIDDPMGYYYLSVIKVQGVYHVCLIDKGGDNIMPFSPHITGINRADCVSKLLFWLLENGRVTVEEVNLGASR